MEIIRFQTNVPQEVRLTSLEGRLVDSKFGGSQHLFYAQEGVFYVSDKVGSILMDQFKKLGVKTGDPIEITKAETGNGPGRKTQWLVTAQSDADETSSELEQKLADSIAVVNARKQPQSAAVEQPAWARILTTQTKHLADAYAEALAYAGEKHGNAIKPEDIRALLTTAFIALSKNGGNAHAA